MGVSGNDMGSRERNSGGMPVHTIADIPLVQDVTTLICAAEDEPLSDHSRLAEDMWLSAIDQLLDRPDAPRAPVEVTA